MKKTFIIAFGHKARRGKDTVVKHLIDVYGHKYDIRRYAFADELKREFTAEVERISQQENASTIVAVRYLERWAEVQHDENMAMDDPLCPYGKPRYLLQWWGGDYRREGAKGNTPDEFYWVRKLRNRIRDEQPQFALISDLRYKNEAAFVKSESLDNRTVRVERHGFDMGQGSGHASETELDDYGYDAEILVEDGNKEELKRDVIELFQIFLSQWSAQYAIASEDLFDKITPRVEPEAIVLPTNTQPVTYRIATPEGTRSASSQDVAEFARS